MAAETHDLTPKQDALASELIDRLQSFVLHGDKPGNQMTPSEVTEALQRLDELLPDLDPVSVPRGRTKGDSTKLKRGKGAELK